MTRAIARFAALLVLAPFLAACFGSAAPPPPRDRYYRILVPGPAASRYSETLAGVISVDRLEADALLRERPVLFSRSGKPHELQQHDYHFWTDPPPGMLQSQLVGYLRAAGIAKAVVTPDMRIKPDYRVAGRVKRLERLLGGGPARALVELELSLVRVSDGKLIVIDTYTVEKIGADATVEASVTAMSAAVADIFERFVGGAMSTQLSRAKEE